MARSVGRPIGVQHWRRRCGSASHEPGVTPPIILIATINECPVRTSFKNFKGVIYIDDYNGGEFAGVITIDRGRQADTMLESAMSLVSGIFGSGSSRYHNGEPDLVQLHLN